MDTATKTYGRTELAQAYFPNISAKSAWQRLKSLMADTPSLADLSAIHRRYFLPAEVQRIFNEIGRP